MADNSSIIRAATAQDGSLLADMLPEAVNWSITAMEEEEPEPSSR